MDDEEHKLSISIQIEANHGHDIDYMLRGLCAQISATPGYKPQEPKVKAKVKPCMDFGDASAV